MLSIPNELSDFLSVPRKIVIITHYNPDGDAIGSSLGLYNALLQKQHNVNVIVPNEFPTFLKWIEGSDKILNFANNKQEAADTICAAEMVFCLDFNSLSRLDEIAKCFEHCGNNIVMIDHHPEPDNFAKHTFSVTEKSSTCELVFEFLESIGWQETISKNVAECLMTGIMTDTGCFVHNSSHPRTYEIMAALTRTGADKDFIYSQVFDNYSFNRLQLMGYCLNEKLVYMPQYHVAYMSLSRKEQNRFSMQTGDTEGFVNIPFSIKGIWVTALFTEKQDKIRISFRSKGKFAVNKFSETYFNGGGHHNAAGGESKLGMKETLRRFEELIIKHADEIKEPHHE
jgi:bifunctional oligoribonuclease and PAP phosphatase NrnA